MDRKTFLLSSAASVAAATTPALSAAAQSMHRTSRAPVNLKFTTWMGASEGKAFRTVLKVFEKNNPGITVSIVDVSSSSDNYGRNKVETMIAANTPPDVLQTNTGQFEAYAARGVLLNLSPYYKTDHVDTTIYVPGSMQGCTYGGHIYATPRFISDVVMFYNKDLFKKAGVPFPKKDWTWYDFRNAALKLTDPKNHRWGFGMTNITWNWQPFVVGNGGQIINAAHTKCLMEDPRTIEALQFFYDLQSKDKVAPAPGSVPPGQAFAGDQFIAQTVAMAVLGPWERPGIVASHVKFDWEMAPMPVSPHTHRSSNVFYVDQWAVAAAANHPQEAWQLVKWLGSIDFHQRWLSAYGASSIDCVRAVDESPAWLHYGGSSGQIAIDELKNGAPPPINYANGDQVENTWDQEFQLVQLGQETAAQAVAKIVPKIDAILARGA